MDSISTIIDEVDLFSAARSEIVIPEEISSKIIDQRHSIKVLTQNIRSVHKNFSLLEVLLARMNITCDVIILTECWLNNLKPPPNLANYNTFSTKRSINQNDGVIVYIKQYVSCSVEEPTFIDGNCLLIKIGKDLVILGIYRPPSFRNIDNFINSIDKILDDLPKTSSIIIMGDINIDIKTHNRDSRSSEYLNFLAEKGLLPAHTIPTREANCLDHVFTSKPDFSSAYIVNSALTDHLPVVLCYQTTNFMKPLSKVSKIDYDGVINAVNNTDFSQINLFSDPNTAMNFLTYKLSQAIVSHTKLLSIPRNRLPLKPWITPGVLRCIRHRDRLHIKTKNYQQIKFY